MLLAAGRGHACRRCKGLLCFFCSLHTRISLRMEGTRPKRASGPPAFHAVLQAGSLEISQQ